MKKNVKIAILTLTVFILLAGITATTAADTNTTNTQLNTQSPTITSETTQTTQQNTTVEQTVSKSIATNTNVETTTQKTNTNNNKEQVKTTTKDTNSQSDNNAQTTVKSASKDTTNTIQTTQASNTVKTNSIKQNTNSQVVTPTTNISQKSLKTLKQASEQNYYVSDSTGVDTNDGLSSTTAFKTIAKAISSTTNTQTYNIHILTGTYKGVGNTNLTVPGDYTINFIGDGIGKTIIDGEVNYTEGTGTVWGGSSVWSYYNIKSGNWGMNITSGSGTISVSGITFEKMLATGGSRINLNPLSAGISNYGNLKVNNVSFYFNLAGVGAGIENFAGSTLYVNNSIFSENRKSAGSGNFGAGIYNNGTAVVENTQFLNNYARWGTVTNDHVITINNCTFKDNFAYDGASTYKYGSGIAANTGEADFFNRYNIEGLTTTITNCTFKNNTQTDIWQGKGNLSTSNNVFNGSSGIYVSSNGRNDSVRVLIENNTFTNMISSNLFGSLSVKTGTTFAIYSLGQYNTTIRNNTITSDSGYGMLLTGYTNVYNNTITRPIYINGNYNNVTKNTINTDDTYAVTLGSNAKYNNVSDNTIYSNIFTGNRAVSTENAFNTIENNIPASGIDINVTNENYTTYFNADGTLKTDVVGNGSTINIVGDIYNKNLTFDNVKVYLKNINSHVLYNSSIKITSTAKAIVEDIIINNTNANAYALLAESNGNYINNNKFIVNSTSLIHTVVLIGNNTIFKSNTINTNGPSNAITYDSNNYGVADTIGLLIESSNNTVTGNTFNTGYTTKQNYGTIESISVQTPTEKTSGNTLKNTITTTGDQYVYGMNIQNSDNNYITGGTYTTNSNYYGNGIQILNSNNNDIIATINVNSTEYGYGVIIDGLNGISNANTLTGVTINNITANKVYGIELVNANNTKITSNSYSNQYFLYGNYTMGIGTYNTNNTEVSFITFYNIGTKNTTDETDYNVIKPRTTMFDVINSANFTVKGISVSMDNMNGYVRNTVGNYLVAVNSTGIDLLKGSNGALTVKIMDTPIILINTTDSVINGTNIQSNSTYMVELINSTKNNITNNYLENTLKLNGGNEAVSTINSQNNIIENNTPTITVLTNDNYNNYFTNGILTKQIDIITLGSDLYNKNMTFNNKTEINNPNGYTIYNGTITFNTNTTGSTVNNVRFNSTDERQTIIYANATQITLNGLNIYQQNYKNLVRTIVFDGNNTDSSSNPLIEDCNITISGPEIQTTTGLPSIIAISMNSSRFPSIYENNITVGYTTSDKKGTTLAIYAPVEDASISINSNNVNVTGDNNAVYFMGTSIEGSQYNPDHIIVKSNNNATGIIVKDESTYYANIQVIMNVSAQNNAVGVMFNNITEPYGDKLYYSTITVNSNNTGKVVEADNTGEIKYQNNNFILNAKNGVIMDINNSVATIRNNQMSGNGSITILNLANMSDSDIRTIGSNTITLNTTTTNPLITLNNINKVNIKDNTIIANNSDAPIISIINSENSNVTGNYLSTNNMKGNNAVQTTNSANVIIKNNEPTYAINMNATGTSTTNTSFNVTVTDTNTNSNINTGNVTLSLPDGTILGTIDLSNPTSISYLLTPAGTYNITATYTDNDNVYNNFTTNITVTVDKNNNNSLVVTPIPGTTTKDTVFDITAYDQNNNIIKTGTVTLVLSNGTTIGTIDLSKNSTINYLFTTNGNYTVVATYTDPSNVYGNLVDILTVNINDRNVNMNVTVTPGTTISNTTFNVKVTDNSNNTLTNGTLYFYNNNTLIGTVIVTNSTPTFNYIFNSTGTYNITVKYNNTNYNSNNKTVNFTITKANTKITVNPITGTVNDNITIQANITDINGNNVNEGTVTFRINGSTLKDTKGNMIFVNVTNGKALLNYIIPSSWAKNNLTIEAIYHGTNTYNPSTNTNTINVTKITPNITIVNGNINTKYNSTTPITVQVTDNNGNFVKSGKIALKLNGKTIGHANVINGIATYNYTTQNSARTYNLSVVFGSNGYNKGQTSTNFTVQKQNTQITTNPIFTSKGSTITITGLIKNNDQNPIDHNTKIAIKIDGKTIGHTTSNNGLINYNYTIPTNYKTTTHTITIISGADNFYNGSTTTTTLTINNKQTIKTGIKI